MIKACFAQTLLDKRGMPDHMRQRLAKELKGLRVEVMHRGAQRRKFRVCNVTRLGADRLTFPDEVSNQTVKSSPVRVDSLDSARPHRSQRQK